MASGRQDVAEAPGGVDSLRGGKSRDFIFYAIAALLSLVGLTDTVYLTVKHITGGPLQCTITSGCEYVLSSPYSTIAGIPLAAIGALAYFTVFSLATLAAFGNRKAGTLLFFLVILMFLVSVWLFYLQAFKIQHYCQYCLLSGALSVLLTLTMLAQRLYSRRAAKV